MTDRIGTELGDEIAERARLALWATKSAVWDWDIEKNLFYSSSENQTLLSRGEEEFTEKFDLEDGAFPWDSRLHPDDRAQVLQRLRDHFENDTPFDLEYRYRRTNEEIIWIRSIGRAVRAMDGRPLRMVGMNSDVTKQKLAENDTQHFREAMDNISEAIVLYDADERFVYANERHLNMVPAIRHLLKPGADRETIRQAFVTSGALFADTETAKELMVEKRRRQLSSGTIELQLANGLWMKNSDHILPDGRCIGVRTDITEIKQREQVLRDSEARFRAIYEGADFGIAISNLGGQMLSCNPAWETMLGYGRGELEGKPLSHNSHPDDIAENAENSERLLRGDIKSYRIEARYICKDGKTLWVNLTVSLVDDYVEHSQVRLAMIEDISERKSAQQALAESQTSLVHAQKMAHLGSWAIDHEKNAVTWSDEVYRMFGLENSEFDGRQGSFLTFVHPEDRERARQHADNLQNGMDSEFTYRVIRPDGQERVVHSQGVITHTVGGLPRQARGFIQDITEQEKAEELLRKSEAHLNTAQRISHIGSWEYDGQSKSLTWSEETYRIYNVLRDEFQPTLATVLELINPDDRSKLELAREGVLYRNQPMDVELRILVRDGEIRDLHVLGQVISGPPDKPASMSGTVQDITERTQIENTLREKEHMLRGIFETAAIGISACDRDGRMIEFNPAYQEMLGYTEEELRSKTLWDVTHPDDHHLEEPHFVNMLTGRSASYRFEKRYIHKNGSVIWVNLNVANLKDAAGIVIGTLSTVEDITERKQVEDTLREREHLLRGIFETAAIGICACDREGKFIQFNPAYHKMLGLTAEELNRLTFWDVTHPDDYHLKEPHYADMITDRVDSYRFEKKFLHKNGSIIWVNMNVAGLKNAEGQVIGTLAAVEDITERKRKEQILAESEARLADAQKIGQIGNWERSLVTQKLVWSDQQFSLFGYDRNKGLPSLEMFLDRIHPDDRALVENAIREQYTEGGGHHFDYRIILPTGEMRFIQERVGQTLDDSGMVVALKGTAQDITELKRVEADLRESEARLAEAQQLANVGSWTVLVEDGKQAKSIWSTELCRIFGIPQEDVPQGADAYASMVPEQDHDLVNQAWAKSLDTGIPYELEHRIVRPNGEIRFVRTNARLFKEQAPGATHWIGATSDITDRKIAEEKLRQVQSMEAVGQLTGGVAHDFSNFLAVIMGNLELVSDRVGDNSPLRSMIERSMKASDRGATLTQRLLSFSRKQTLMPTDLNLTKVVIGVTDMLHRSLGETIEIDIAGQEGLWLCAADQSQLESALLNLAGNARDAMTEGGRLTIETRNISMDDEDVAMQAEVDPGAYVMIGVTDTGCGIASETLKHVFEPFFTTKDVGKGSGLGLSWA